MISAEAGDELSLTEESCIDVGVGPGFWRSFPSYIQLANAWYPGKLVVMGDTSISSDSQEKVSREKLMAYVSEAFDRADEDGDGALNISELSAFLCLLSHPPEDAGKRARTHAQ